jgi:hypothetical protein
MKRISIQGVISNKKAIEKKEKKRQKIHEIENNNHFIDTRQCAYV